MRGIEVSAQRLLPPTYEGCVIRQSADDARRPGSDPGTHRRAAAHQVRARPGTSAEGAAMKQLRITKRHRPDDWRLEPLPLDPRDPDIVRAKELARRSRAVASRPGRAQQTGN